MLPAAKTVSAALLLLASCLVTQQSFQVFAKLRRPVSDSKICVVYSFQQLCNG